MKPEEFARMESQFRLAVYENCLGWFCHEYNMGKIEWDAKSPLALIADVAMEIDRLKREVENGTA